MNNYSCKVNYLLNDMLMRSCTVSSFRAGKELRDGPDFEITYERGGRVRLVIPDVLEGDAGRYTCTAQNKGGQVSSSAELVVKGGGGFFSFRNFLVAFTKYLIHLFKYLNI